MKNIRPSASPGKIRYICFTLGYPFIVSQIIFKIERLLNMLADPKALFNFNFEILFDSF